MSDNEIKMKEVSKELSELIDKTELLEKQDVLKIMIGDFSDRTKYNIFLDKNENDLVTNHDFECIKSILVNRLKTEAQILKYVLHELLNNEL